MCDVRETCSLRVAEVSRTTKHKISKRTLSHRGPASYTPPVPVRQFSGFVLRTVQMSARGIRRTGVEEVSLFARETSRTSTAKTETGLVRRVILSSSATSGKQPSRGRCEQVRRIFKKPILRAQFLANDFENPRIRRQSDEARTAIVF